MLPSRLDGDPRLEALRSVLLEQDRAVRSRGCSRSSTTRSSSPKRSAPCWPTPFALAAARDEQLAKALAPTLERATQASIRKDPGTLVGILYPLVGPAIRKSIAETLDGTLQRLNQAFKHSFSWQRLKWRLEALRSGSSFADVVLKHTVEFRVEHLFLIHRKTGTAPRARGRHEAATARIRSWSPACSPPSRTSCAIPSTRLERQRRRHRQRCGSATCCCGAKRDRSRFWPPSSGATRPRRSTPCCAKRSPAFTKNCAARSRNSTATTHALGDLARAAWRPACSSSEQPHGDSACRPGSGRLPLALLLARRVLAGSSRASKDVASTPTSSACATTRRGRHRRRAPRWSSGTFRACAIRWPPIRRAAGAVRSRPGTRRRPLGALPGAGSGHRAQAPRGDPATLRPASRSRWTAAPSAPTAALRSTGSTRRGRLIAALPAGSPRGRSHRASRTFRIRLRSPARRHPGARHQFRLECAAARARPGRRARCPGRRAARTDPGGQRPGLFGARDDRRPCGCHRQRDRRTSPSARLAPRSSGPCCGRAESLPICCSVRSAGTLEPGSPVGRRGARR